MKKIGIICEYNPFHNGHLYHIEKIKEMYPDSLIVLALGGYFLERGDVSIMSKWTKTSISLEYGVDLVLELPVLFGTNSGDYFAYYAIKMLDECGIDVLVFGSECDDVELLKKVADLQNDEGFNESVKNYLKQGLNYPSSLAKSLNIKLESNDLLGVSYIKAIKRINPSIEVVSIKRSNSFNDLESESDIVSAQNIRTKLKQNLDIRNYVPSYDLSLINKINYNKLYDYLKYRIVSEKNIIKYLGVDEGLENKIRCEITDSPTLDEFIENIKSKRYTTSRLKRMLIHILLGIEKDDMKCIPRVYKILGFNSRGQKFLKELGSDSLAFKTTGRIRDIENASARIYGELTGESVTFEFLNKPIIKN